MSEIARDRDEALLFGMQHYYGTPCAKPGHGNVRRAANKHCCTCGVEYDARRRAGMTEAQKEAERARKREAKRAGLWVGEDPIKKRERGKVRRQRERESPEALLRRQRREMDSLVARLSKAGGRIDRATRQRDMAPIYAARRVMHNRIKAASRRALKRGFDSEIVATGADIQCIREAQRDQCAYCGSTGDLHLDHITPVSRGGRHTIDNLQFLCAPHNMAKHNSDDVEFRASIGVPQITPWDGYAARALWYGLAAAA